MVTTMVMMTRLTPLLHALTPDGRVLLVSAIVSVAIVILIAGLPAWRAVHAPVAGALQRGRSIAGSTGRTGTVLLVAQVMLSMVLAVAAGLFARSLANLQANDAGFRRRPIVWTRLWRKPGERGPLDAAYWRELLIELAKARGVDAVTASDYFPAYLSYPRALPTDTYALATDSSVSAPALTEVVSPGFFDTFGISRLRGRDFRWNDDERSTPTAIVNETIARDLFPNEGAVGRHLKVTERGKPIDVQVVGVVSDAPIGRLREPHQPVVFRPLLQEIVRVQEPSVHIRVRGDIAAASADYIRIVESRGHHLVQRLFTLDGFLDWVVLQERLVAGIAVYAAALALLLGCIGIYGLVAYSVTMRLPELGLRIALGASAASVVRLVVHDGLIIVGGGVLLAVPCALAAGRFIQAQLYGVVASDLTTLVIAGTAFILTGVTAALLPASRAARVDPMIALRAE
jgi:predicted permease